MVETTLCYLRVGNKTLFLYRNKKENDVNRGKWIGIGGKIKKGESPEKSMLREFTEETGLVLKKWEYRGVVDFEQKDWKERMHLFTATDYTGKMKVCNEGTLKWIDNEKIIHLTMWEGDHVFLPLLESNTFFFNLKLIYDGETLKDYTLNVERF